MVAGNHDTPRSTDTGSHPAAVRRARPARRGCRAARARLSRRSTSRCSPSPTTSTSARSSSRPGTRRWNVLLLHGEVEGMLGPFAATREPASQEIAQDELDASAWDYIALGHYHVYRRIAPNQFYSGSLDYTSTNTWGEQMEEELAGVPGKGIIEHDLATGRHTFHHAAAGARVRRSAGAVGARAHDGRGERARRSPRSTPARAGSTTRSCAWSCATCRATSRAQLDHRQLRDFRRRALHFHLDTRRPEMIRSVGHGAPGRRPSLADFVRDKLRERVVAADVDRDALVELGLRYLKDAEEREGASAASPPGLEGVDAPQQPAALQLPPARRHASSASTPGSPGIIGPNGSGKTTILEAIAWALYGQDAARGKKETIRSLRAGPAREGEGGARLRARRPPLSRGARAHAAPSSTSTAPTRRSRTRSPASPTCCVAGSA